MARGKNRSAARQAVKNKRRLLRRDGRMPNWMRGQPILKTGMGGTDKSGTVRPSPTYYSQANAEKTRGKPAEWPGIPYRGK